MVYYRGQKIEVKRGDKIECSEIKISISSLCKMSSYSQSATRRSSSSSTSYTYGIPGSQVTISLNKSGNHTLTLSRGPNPNSKTSSSVPVPVADRKFPDGRVGPANTPFCKVCYDAGLPVADYTNHYVKDQPGPGGKVVCPTLMAQKCFKCGVAGHTSSYCPEEARRERERKEREREAKKRMNATDVNGWKVVGDVSASTKPHVQAAPAPAPAPVATLPVARGSFSLLAVDDDSSSSSDNERDSVQQQPQPQEQEQEQEPEKQEQQPAKPLTWAQRAAAAATKAPTTSTTGSGSSSGSSSSNGISMTTGFRVPHVVDTRFQLHALCQNISVTQRGSSAKKAAATANHRGNAAAVAREGSLKRKQESVTIPA